jgi:ribosome-associated protein
MRSTLTITDYFVIVTGTNRRQVQAIAAEIERRMKSEGEPRPRIEGYPAGKWVLLDLDRVVVHVFDEETRAYYGLEHLWADSPEVQIETGTSGAAMTAAAPSGAAMEAATSRNKRDAAF